MDEYKTYLINLKWPPHLVQACLSCEWVAKCLLNWYVSLKLFSHWVHKYPSFLCLNFLWSLKAPELVYEAPHTSQISFFLFASSWVFDVFSVNSSVKIIFHNDTGIDFHRYGTVGASADYLSVYKSFYKLHSKACCGIISTISLIITCSSIYIIK